MTNPILNAPIPEQIAYVGRLMFERKLTDMAGGNISVRDGDQIYISPRYAGSRQHWHIDPEDVLCGPWATDELFSHPRMSREAKAHIAIYRNFADVGAVIHAHPFHVLPFVVAGRPIEPVLEANQKFGVTPIVPFAPAHSDDLAHHVVESLRGREAAIRKQAAAVLASNHGAFIAGANLFHAIDALERLDWNAWCILAQGLLPEQPVPYKPALQ